MDQEKFAQMQLQMKQNNSDYQNFLSDLDSWETDVKTKDKHLKEEKPTGQNALPPVRNSLEKKKKKKKKKPKVDDKEQSHVSEKNQKIKGFDYRSWDKFDVDAACEDLDKEASESSEAEYETDEEWESERMKLQAVQHKEQGNQFFKKSDYINAIESYTKGIECDPENAVLPANRAMALLKQESYAVAELDCTRSITLDPSYIKAYHRRGTARAALKKYTEAKDDFLQVLKNEPQNKQAKAELEKVERLLNPPKLLQSKNLDTSDIGIVKAVYKPPNQRSQKPLRRIVIEEIGNDEKEAQRKQRMMTVQAQQSETTKLITAQDNSDFDKLVLTDRNADSNNSTKIEKISENKIHQTEKSRIYLQVKTENNENNNQVLGSKEEIKGLIKPSEEKAIKQKPQSNVLKNGGENTGKLVPRVPPVPISSYQFQADWKSLKHSAEDFYQYFKEIEPSTFPKLFGQFLDADVLSKIFSTLKLYYLPNEIDPYPVLMSLCDVKRFTMTVMFMSSQDKKGVQEIFSHMKKLSVHSNEDLEKLSRKYEI